MTTKLWPLTDMVRVIEDWEASRSAKVSGRNVGGAKMPISPYVRAVRDKIGSDLLMLQAVTMMLFDDQGRLLIARDAETGFWMTIGGAVEPDETPSDAAVREFWEETGLLVEPTSLVGIFGGPDFRVDYPNGDIVSYVVTVFEVRQIGGEASPDGSEVSALCFASRSEASSLPMRGWTREMIARTFEYKESGAIYFSKARWRPKAKRVAARPRYSN